MRKPITSVLAIFASIATLVITAPTASAAGVAGCPGSLIDTYPVKTASGAVWGNIYLYYSGTLVGGHGYNCAATVANSAGGYGQPNVTMKVTLARCAEYSPGSRCDPVGATGPQSDNGVYKYYAGPVEVNLTKGHCVSVTGFIQRGRERAKGQSSPLATHCG
ncbi:hypothetical protein [Streptomyces sp. NPDC001774]